MKNYDCSLVLIRNAFQQTSHQKRKYFILNQSINQSINQLVHPSIYPSINQLIK